MSARKLLTWMIHGPARPTFELGSFCLSSCRSTFMYGMHACDVTKGPVRFVSRYACHWSRVEGSAMVFPSAQYGCEIPALLTRKSIRPSRNLAALSMVERISSTFRKSHLDHATRSACSFKCSSAVCLTLSSLTSRINILWPRDTK